MLYEMKPRSAVELLDAGFALYRDHFAAFLTIAACTTGVASAFQILTFRYFVGTWGAADSVAESSANMTGTFNAWSSYLVVGAAAYVFASAALMRATADAYHGRTFTARQAFSRVLPSIPAAAVASAVCGAGITFGFVFFIIPGVLLSLRWAFTEQAIVLESASVGSSLARSRDLTREHRSGIGTILLLVTLLIAVINVGLTLIFSAAIKDLPLLLAALKILPILVTSPLHTIVMTLAYYDLRIRKEAYDLEIAASRDAMRTTALGPAV